MLQASDDLNEAGVLVHMWDHLEEATEPWRPCYSGWCKDTDHMSCSLINHQMANLYTYSIGVVLHPSVGFVCAYTADGGTQAKSLGGCHDDPGRCNAAWWWGCAWYPDQLAEMVRTKIDVSPNGYDEFVISTQAWVDALPDAIQAVICRDDCDGARAVHAGYLEAYGRTAAQTPLLRYDPDDGFDVMS